MRIISGSLKGRVISGQVHEGVRPTTDRMRQSIFSALEHYQTKAWSECEVLDICAGTGALGFEALSRGAKRCIFVEKNPIVAKTIRSNAEELSISKEDSPIALSDALTFLATIQTQQYPKDYPNSWDIIFCDPPYSARLLNKVVDIIVLDKLLTAHGLFIAEHDTVETILPPKELSCISSLEFGVTQVDILHYSNIKE